VIGLPKKENKNKNLNTRKYCRWF